MENLRISVIIVTYNSVLTLEESIKSYISQKYKNKELLIIDNNSDDGTVDIIKRYGSYIDYWISEADEGIFYAMNKGLREITGDIVFFLGSDDFFISPNLFDIVNKNMNDNNTDMLLGRIICGNRIIQSEYSSLRELLIGKQFPHHQALFAKSLLFKKYGMFNEEYRYMADHDWIIRVCSGGIVVKQFDEVVSWFSTNGISQVFECKMERLKIDLIYAVGNELENDIPLIFNKYIAIGRNSLLEAFNPNKDIAMKNFILKMMGDTEYCSIWGRGNYGKKILHMLRKLGIPIKKIIDTRCANCDEYDEDILISKFNPEDDYGLIVIGTMAFENEIIKELEICGYQRRKDYICCSDILKGIDIIVKEQYLKDSFIKRCVLRMNQ